MAVSVILVIRRPTIVRSTTYHYRLCGYRLLATADADTCHHFATASTTSPLPTASRAFDVISTANDNLDPTPDLRFGRCLRYIAGLTGLPAVLPL